MSAKENKALARRWVEGLFNDGNLNVADEILSPNFVLHATFGPRELRAPEAVKQIRLRLPPSLPRRTYHHRGPDSPRG
jgi:hypothetical protein